MFFFFFFGGVIWIDMFGMWPKPKPGELIGRIIYSDFYERSPLEDPLNSWVVHFIQFKSQCGSVGANGDRLG